MGKLKDFFVPHEGNAYQPHSLQKAAVSGMVVLVLLSFTLANIQSLIWISSDWMVSTILPSVIVELTNEQREGDNLSGLRRNEVLDAAARMKAQHMADNEYFAHYSPNGVSPWHWFSEANYNFVHAGENLAIHFTDSDEVVEAWMDSPTHRANILNGDYAEIGVGAVEGEFDGYRTVYVVQLFGTPAAEAAAAESEPEPVPEQEPTVLAQTQPSETETATDTQADTESAQTAPTTTDEALSQGEQNDTATASEPDTAQIAGSEDVVTQTDDTQVSLSTDRDPVEVAREQTATESATATETTIERVVSDSDSVALYSGLISTSTGGIPATIDPGAQPSGDSGAGIAGVLTQPQLILQILYSVIALFVVAALMLAIFIEIRRQHPVQIAYSAGLMAIMAGLFYVHLAITSGAVII